MLQHGAIATPWDPRNVASTTLTLFHIRGSPTTQREYLEFYTWGFKKSRQIFSIRCVELKSGSFVPVVNLWRPPQIAKDSLAAHRRTPTVSR